MNETTQQFGASWSLVLPQVVAILFGSAVLIVFPLVVTLSCVRRFRGDGRFALWLAIVWLIPILGPLFGLWVAQAFLIPRVPENVPQRSISNWDATEGKMKPPLKVALIAVAALAILWTVCYIWGRNTSDYEWHSEMIVRPDPPSK